MEYYKLLQLDREPFSNSPDPDYFFQSRQHLGCMQKLELALRLKRGLNVVIGDVGTGKTTICRQLIRKFSREGDFECHLILDPSFSSGHDFLGHIHDLFCEDKAGSTRDVALKEGIKQALFRKGVEQNQTLVLLIDEGQKIPEPCLEILRELLNYETNTFKLLQIIIFAQIEFEAMVGKHANFCDRINVWHHLSPMDFKDTRRMVRHRLKLSSSLPSPARLFTLPAMWAIYRASRGYPRKIIHLCHQGMLAMIIQNRTRAGWSLIRSCRKRMAPSMRPLRKGIVAGLLVFTTVLAVWLYLPRTGGRTVTTTQTSAFKITPPMDALENKPEALPTAAAPESRPSTKFESLQTAANASIEPDPSPLEESPDPQTSPIPADMTLHPSPETDLDPIQSLTAEMPKSQPPTSLGKLIVRPGDTMVGMLNRVYGTFRNRYLAAVIEINPQIADPNRIDIGQVIEFPPLPFDTKPLAGSRHWIVLQQLDTLPTAMQRVQEITSNIRVPMQLVPAWTPADGLQFFLQVKGYFAQRSEALNYLEALPQDIAAHGYVRSQWPQEAILYANPYVSGNH